MGHQLLLLIFYPISALFFFSDNHQMQILHVILHFILRKREIFSILRCCAFAEVFRSSQKIALRQFVEL